MFNYYSQPIFKIDMVTKPKDGWRMFVESNHVLPSNKFIRAYTLHNMCTMVCTYIYIWMMVVVHIEEIGHDPDRSLGKYRIIYFMILQ